MGGLGASRAAKPFPLRAMPSTSLSEAAPESFPTGCSLAPHTHSSFLNFPMEGDAHRSCPA